MSEQKVGFEGWAILEIMGHRKLGGHVQFDPPELPGLVRIDVIADADTPIATQYYGTSAIFCMTPTTEEVARRMAKSCEVRPAARWELPALDAPAMTDPDDDDDEIQS